MSGADRALLKRRAAEAAANLVADGMVVGLGTGSTASLAIETLIRRVAGGLSIVGIPTSERSAEQARAGGIRLTDFASTPRIDLTIDGADEILPGPLDLIKGLGGALLREKIVAAASARLVIVADDAKLVDRLGRITPLPVEVVEFGVEVTTARLADLGARTTTRMAGEKPFRTDGGNLIIDCAFGPVADAPALDAAIRGIVGVIETGFFIGMASEAFVAGAEGIQHMVRQCPA